MSDQMIRHFINLTNGIEAIKEHDLAPEECEFVRIRSTDCEHKMGAPQWDAILCELETALLMALARGDRCIVYDYSKSRDMSHALSHGIAWIRFALNLAWFGQVTQPVMVDGEDLSGLFARQWWKGTSVRAKKKLRYFQRFKDTHEIRLEVVPGRTKHDGDWGYYLEVLRSVGR